MQFMRNKNTFRYTPSAIARLSSDWRFKQQSGFTLLEVLISAVILFLVIAMLTQIFSTSSRASKAAERAVKVTSSMPLFVQSIREELTQETPTLGSQKRGQGELLGLRYAWTAEVTDFKAPPDRIDVDLGEMKQYQPKFALWHVELIIGQGDYERIVSYREFTWKETNAEK